MDFITYLSILACKAAEAVADNVLLLQRYKKTCSNPAFHSHLNLGVSVSLDSTATSKNKSQSPHYYEIMEFDPLAPTE